MKPEIKTKQWKWRDGELSVKTFYSLSPTDKQEYIFLLEGLKPEEISTQDEYLLRFYGSKKKNNFYSLDNSENL